MITCNRCMKPKLIHEMRAGKLHCKDCRNEQQNRERRERLERMEARGEATPRSHIGEGTYTPTPSYCRNDGLKHIQSRGMPT